MSEAQMHQPLLEVKGLKEYFDINMGFFRTKPLKAVDDVSFTINKGETLGLVGESGCGKTTVGRTILQLYKPTAGEIIYDGKPVKTKADLQKFRTKATMVFQDPYSSLNPRMTVSDIVGEPLDVHHLYSSKKEREERILQLLGYVGLNSEHASRYAHEFSGGQRQRIGIARALAVNPEFIVCDEPVSALDVSIQAQVINMFDDLQDRLGLTYLFIAHDLLVVRHISDRIAVMYLGKMVELASAEEIYNHPLHPYSKSLLSAVPLPDPKAARAEVRRAIGLLFDRNYIVEEIGQAGQVPASSFVPMGMTDADGSEFYKNAGHVEGITGYYDVTDDEDVYMANFDKAVETLKKYYTYDEENGVFTNFPSLTYLYNTSEAHKAIGEYLQSAVSAVGITMNLTNQEWNTFLNTRKSGDYSIARNGWIADYNDPICFLDMWVTGSGNNDVQFGKGANADLKIYNLDLTPYGYDVKVENGTWAETYDVLISAIKSCTNSTNRYAMMHIAEDMLMNTGCIVPLYYYTDIYMLDDSVQGFFSNPLGYKYFMHCTVAK